MIFNEHYIKRASDFMFKMKPNKEILIGSICEKENTSIFIKICKTFMDENNTIDDYWEFSSDYKFLKRKQ